MKNYIHLILKPKDADLHGWKACLLPRTLNKTVNEILLAESKGKIARVPFEFSLVENAATLSCVIRIADDNVSRFVEALPKGNKSDTIKKIIRKHIRKNKELPPREVGISTELLATKLEALKDLLIQKSNACAGEHDKNRRLKVVYKKVFEIAFIKILDCYRLEDEENGDALLQNLEIEKIVNLEFTMVFDKIIKLLQLGIPDEEFESLMNHIKTTEVNN